MNERFLAVWATVAGVATTLLLLAAAALPEWMALAVGCAVGVGLAAFLPSILTAIQAARTAPSLCSGCRLGRHPHQPQQRNRCVFSDCECKEVA